MVNIKERVEEKKQRALELRIGEKADFIARVIGKGYSYNHVGGGGLSGDGITIYNGFVAYTDNLKIDSCQNSSNEKYVKISLLQKTMAPFLFLFIKEWKREHEVYSESKKDSKINVDRFRDEEKWLRHFDDLYSHSLEIEKEKGRQKEIEDREREEKWLKDNFGV